MHRRVLAFDFDGRLAENGVEAGKLVGIVNMDNIMELIAIQKALHEDHKQTHWQA